MKLEKKQIAILVSGVVVVLVLIGGAWVLVSSRPNTAGMPNRMPTESVAGSPGENGTGNPANAAPEVQSPVAAAMDTPVTDVKTKDEATKAIGDLDTLVDSAGNDTE